MLTVDNEMYIKAKNMSKTLQSFGLFSRTLQVQHTKLIPSLSKARK